MNIKGSIKGMAKLAAIKKDAKALAKNVYEVFDLHNPQEMEEWNKILQQHFNQKSWDCDDISLHMNLLGDITKSLEIMKQYGLTDKNYYIDESKREFVADSAGKHQIHDIYIHFPYGKIPSETFWRAVGFEASAKINQRIANNIYKMHADTNNR